jgi:hypothetical protein
MFEKLGWQIFGVAPHPEKENEVVTSGQVDAPYR